MFDGKSSLSEMNGDSSRLAKSTDQLGDRL